MDKYFYFYDLNEILIDRYPSKIAQNISQKIDCDKFVFIYSEKYKYNKPKNIPYGSKFFYIKDLSKNKLDEIISKFPPNSLTTIAQRIPDMWMICYFNFLGYPTYIVQHGLWSDRLKRIPIVKLIAIKFGKFLNYVKHVRSISKIGKIPFSPLLIDLYKFLLIENVNIPETKYLNNNLLRAKKAFVFDESWNDYYVKKYGYNLNDLLYIGNPDYLILKEKNIEQQEDAVCYLCQSLIEDGRFSVKEYKKFLKILKEEVSTKKKLYIKLHPRSKIKYYKILNNNKNIIFTDELPVCKYYIAHYTALLATVYQISSNILIWLLPNHHTPEYFIKFGSCVTNKIEDLTDFLQNKYFNNKTLLKKMSKDEIQDFNPYETIANYLINSIINNR